MSQGPHQRLGDPDAENCQVYAMQMEIYHERCIFPSKISKALIESAIQLKDARNLPVAAMYLLAANKHYFDDQPKAAAEYRGFPGFDDLRRSLRNSH